MGLNKFAVMYIDVTFFKLYDVETMDNFALWEVIKDNRPGACPLVRDIWEHHIEKPVVYVIESELAFEGLLEHFESNPIDMHQLVLETGRKVW